MPAKRQKTARTSTVDKPVSVSTAAPDAAFGFSDAAEALALALLDACLAEDMDRVHELVREGADAWVQDSQGWTALHCAASVGSTDLIEFLLRSGNAVWSITDNLGLTAGDVAYSLNEAAAYEALLAEGVRSELIKAAMGAVFGAAPEDDDDEDEEVGEDGEKKLSTASDNATFLKSKLVFVKDKTGQEICLDVEGNGVMMGWEKGIMEKTAREMLVDFETRRGRSAADLEGDDVELNVVNVGFGLGIMDTFLQEYRPTTHLIIEPHPDVLAHARSHGWYSKPGVRFYEGTWQAYLADLESTKEPYVAFDAVYFDTYSEHYAHLHAFFDALPNLLRGPDSKFSFFHGLGATSRSFYDVFTSVSELHLREIGLETKWEEVELDDWGDVGPYRLPVCWLDF
ncbi:hypothetical protein RQP46_003412 [Phenoliferia psychrophenolica]